MIPYIIGLMLGVPVGFFLCILLTAGKQFEVERKYNVALYTIKKMREELDAFDRTHVTL